MLFACILSKYVEGFDDLDRNLKNSRGHQTDQLKARSRLAPRLQGHENTSLWLGNVGDQL